MRRAALAIGMSWNRQGKGPLDDCQADSAPILWFSRGVRPGLCPHRYALQTSPACDPDRTR
jgi:hypothetical protein